MSTTFLLAPGWRRHVATCLTASLLLAAAPVLASPQAYLPNPEQNTVSMLDLQTQAVVASIAVGQSPAAIELNPAGTKAYVTNLTGSVSVIDTVSNTVIASIGLGSYLSEIEVSPDGSRVYVMNHFDGFFVIDGNTDTLLESVSRPWGHTANNIAINPQGTELWIPVFSNGSGSRVEIYDLVAQTFLEPIPVGQGPGAITFSDDGSTAYVAQYGHRIGPLDGDGDTVTIIDAASRSVTGSIFVGLSPTALRIDPSGQHLYVTRSSADLVSKVDLASGSVVATLPAGDYPSGLDFSAGGDLLYVVSQFSRDLTVIDTSTDQVVATLAPGFASLQADGGRFIVDPADTTPDSFAFVDQMDVSRGVQVVSNAIVVGGINQLSPVSVSGGEYSIGCNGSFTSAAGLASAGDNICVRHVSAAAPITATHTTLTVGGVSDTFSSTTARGNVAIEAQPVAYVLFTSAFQVRIGLRPTAVLRDADTGVALVGRAVRFSAGSNTLCTAITNASGVAACDVSLPRSLQGLLSGGYAASFEGEPAYSPAADTGNTLGISLF